MDPLSRCHPMSEGSKLSGTFLLRDMLRPGSNQVLYWGQYATLASLSVHETTFSTRDHWSSLYDEIWSEKIDDGYGRWLGRVFFVWHPRYIWGYVIGRLCMLQGARRCCQEPAACTCTWMWLQWGLKGTRSGLHVIFSVELHQRIKYFWRFKNIILNCLKSTVGRWPKISRWQWHWELTSVHT